MHKWVSAGDVEKGSKVSESFKNVIGYFLEDLNFSKGKIAVVPSEEISDEKEQKTTLKLIRFL